MKYNTSASAHTHTHTYAFDGTLIRRDIVYLLMVSALKQKGNQMQKQKQKVKVETETETENIKQQYAKVDLEQTNRAVSRCVVRSRGGPSKSSYEHTLTFGQKQTHTHTPTSLKAGLC